MKRIKLYKHLLDTDFRGTRTKIKNFTKPRVTKANKNKIVTG